MRKLTIGLIGNPNTGKTTLFNQLTGARQRVGNWSGVTVERKEGQFSTASSEIHLIDLPGIRSLTTLTVDTSIDESIACQYLFSDHADLVINVVDASNLESNLFLTLQLLELGVPCIIAMNMQDIAASQNVIINVDALSRQLGCPVVSLTSTRGEGITRLKETIDNHHHNAPLKWVVYPDEIEMMIIRLRAAMPSAINSQQQYWLALQLLEGDINSQKVCPDAVQHLPEIIKEGSGDPGTVIADYRFRAVTKICTTFSNIHRSVPDSLTGMIDKVVLDRWAGIPIFLVVMYLMFVLSINIGAALQPLFNSGSIALFIHGTQWLGYTLHFPKWLTVFMAQGIGAGINTVLPIIPQIGLMYLFLSFLEDSGYMPRAAFVLDRLMQVLGLPGKAFVSLIIGFGCNVPSVMSTRTLDTPRERLISVLISPFMSCGARLAIFSVFAASFFGTHSASLVFSLYVLGIAVAVITGVILRRTLLRGGASPFIMELPVYHRPHIKSLLIHTWQRLKMFITRAGRVIILVSMIISLLSSFSFNGNTVNKINESALAASSKAITPILKPIGIRKDNWQATVGLLTGIMAKEVVVSTLNSLYTGEDVQSGDFNPEEYSLSTELLGSLTDTWEGLKTAVSLSSLLHPIEGSKGGAGLTDGQMGIMSAKFGSISSAYSYLIFVLLYVPCVSVMGAMAREVGRNWMLFSLFWGMSVAFTVATLFYQSLTFCEHPLYSTLWLSGVITVNAAIILLFRKWGKRTQENQPKVTLQQAGCPGCKGCSKS